MWKGKSHSQFAKITGKHNRIPYKVEKEKNPAPQAVKATFSLLQRSVDECWSHKKRLLKIWILIFLNYKVKTLKRQSQSKFSMILKALLSLLKDNRNPLISNTPLWITNSYTFP